MNELKELQKLEKLKELQRSLELYFDAKAAYEDAEAKAAAAVKIYHDFVEENQND